MIFKKRPDSVCPIRIRLASRPAESSWYKLRPVFKYIHDFFLIHTMIVNVWLAGFGIDKEANLQRKIACIHSAERFAQFCGLVRIASIGRKAFR